MLSEETTRIRKFSITASTALLSVQLRPFPWVRVERKKGRVTALVVDCRAPCTTRARAIGYVENMILPSFLPAVISCFGVLPALSSHVPLYLRVPHVCVLPLSAVLSSSSTSPKPGEGSAGGDRHMACRQAGRCWPLANTVRLHAGTVCAQKACLQIVLQQGLRSSAGDVPCLTVEAIYCG